MPVVSGNYKNYRKCAVRNQLTDFGGGGGGLISGCQLICGYMAGSAGPILVNVYRRSGIDSKESIPTAWRASTSKRVVVPARQAGNRLLGSLKGLQIRARMYSVQV